MDCLVYWMAVLLVKSSRIEFKLSNEDEDYGKFML
jgi:hypothetical protein